jgi:hypothetical protein
MFSGRRLLSSTIAFKSPAGRISQGWMPRDELYGVMQIARPKHKDSADLFFGLRLWTVRYNDFAVLQEHVFGRAGRLKSLANNKVPVGSQLIVTVKALTNHTVALVFRHVLKLSRLGICQTDKFHDRPLTQMN